MSTQFGWLTRIIHAFACLSSEVAVAVVVGVGTDILFIPTYRLIKINGLKWTERHGQTHM